jgi:hypothetical protein
MPRTIVCNTEPRFAIQPARAQPSEESRRSLLNRGLYLPALYPREVLRPGRIGRSPGKGRFRAARVLSSDAELREPPLARSFIGRIIHQFRSGASVSGESFRLRDSFGEQGIFVSVQDAVSFSRYGTCFAGGQRVNCRIGFGLRSFGAWSHESCWRSSGAARVESRLAPELATSMPTIVRM